MILRHLALNQRATCDPRNLVLCLSRLSRLSRLSPISAWSKSRRDNGLSRRRSEHSNKQSKSKSGDSSWSKNRRDNGLSKSAPSVNSCCVSKRSRSKPASGLNKSALSNKRSNCNASRQNKSKPASGN